MQWIRLFSLLLCLFSAHQALAGVWLARGDLAFGQRDYQAAYRYFEKSRAWGYLHPDLLGRLGRSAWEEGAVTQNPDWYRRADAALEKWQRQIPFYGRAKLYSALSRIRHAADSLSTSDWEQIQARLLEAVQDEKGSAWTAYQAGTAILSRGASLNEEQKRQAIDLIQRSIGFHRLHPEHPYLDAPSPYLKPALSFLWREFRDPGLLREVTPEDFPSYRTALEFLKENNLWQFYSDFLPRQLELEGQAYRDQCLRGEALLQRGKTREAFLAFRKAFWMRRWVFPRAKAGILVTELAMGELPQGEHPLFREDYRQTVRSILEEPDEPIGALMEPFAAVVKETGDPQLWRLYEDKRNEKAVSSMPPPAPGKSSHASWWGKSGLKSAVDEKGEKLTTEIELPEGDAVISIFIRSQRNAANQFGYGLVLINGRPQQGVYANHFHWRMISVPVRSTGGKRWLEFELLNGTGIELGAVRVDG